MLLLCNYNCMKMRYWAKSSALELFTRPLLAKYFGHITYRHRNMPPTLLWKGLSYFQILKIVCPNALTTSIYHSRYGFGSLSSEQFLSPDITVDMHRLLWWPKCLQLYCGSRNTFRRLLQHWSQKLACVLAERNQHQS